MELKPIPIKTFVTRPFHLFDAQWFLLSSGDFTQGHYNAMTISWGSMGVIWNKPFVQVVVRPTRYTYQFMEQYDSFTLCAFPKDYRRALSLLGSKSGRDGDKIAESGLTPCVASCVSAPVYTEAELVIECRKIYWQDMNPAHFLAAGIQENYPEKDYHRVYYGEIVAILGTPSFS